MTNRDGNQEIYVMDANGSNLRRITRHPGIDATPTWSPAGNQMPSPPIAGLAADLHRRCRRPRPAARITSNESWADRATWSPAPVQRDRLRRPLRPASTSRSTTSRPGDAHPHQRRRIEREPGVLADRPPRRLRLHAPGHQQIFVVGRDGNGLRQVTKEGNNYTPNWSR
jgi:TolB protein